MCISMHIYIMIDVVFMMHDRLAQQILQQDVSRTMIQTPSAKRSYSASTTPQCYRYRKTGPQPSSCGPPKLGEDQANRRYAELQNDLQQIFSDCNELWKSSWRFSDRIEDGFRKSWRAAMGHYEALLRVALFETITSEDSNRLSPLWRNKLGNAAALL